VLFLEKVNILSIIITAFIISLTLFLSLGYSAPNYVNYDFNFTNETNYSTTNVFMFESNWTNTTATGENITWAPTTNFTLGRPDGTYAVFNLTTTPALTNNTTTLPVRLEIVFTQDQLGSAGTYNYSFGINTTNASGTETWTNVTPVTVFTITNSSNPVNLYINGSLNQNVTISYGTQSNATGVAVYSNSGTLYLYRDGVQKATGTDSINETTTLDPGTYAYKVNATGNENYTDNSTGITYYLTVGALADGSSCSANNQCSGGYCVHNICRSNSVYCGDAYCDAGESCWGCVGDCGVCPGGGGCASENQFCYSDATCCSGLYCVDNKCKTTRAAPIEEELPEEEVPEEEVLECIPNWQCTDWSECVEEIQTRTCTDSNNCGTTVNKPTESQSCEMPAFDYTPYIVVVIIIIIVVVAGGYFLRWYRSPIEYSPT